MSSKKYQKGIGLIEVIVAVFVLTTVLSTLITVNNLYIKTSRANIKMTQGAYLASEAVEAIKTIRDNGWDIINAIPMNTTYYLYFNSVSSSWFATTTVESIPDFSRSFSLNNVYRDQYGDISSSGTLDPNTKKLEVHISWHTSPEQLIEKKIITYIANILE